MICSRLVLVILIGAPIGTKIMFYLQRCIPMKSTVRVISRSFQRVLVCFQSPLYSCKKKGDSYESPSNIKHQKSVNYAPN